MHINAVRAERKKTGTWNMVGGKCFFIYKASQSTNSSCLVQSCSSELLCQYHVDTHRPDHRCQWRFLVVVERKHVFRTSYLGDDLDYHRYCRDRSWNRDTCRQEKKKGRGPESVNRFHLQCLCRAC